jgi:hypothetical protein
VAYCGELVAAGLWLTTVYYLSREEDYY